MKLKENACFESLNSNLNFEAGMFRIIGRLESYSCKMVNSEKKQFKQMNKADGLSPNDLEALSPPKCSPLNGSLNLSMDEQADELDVTKIRRKTLFYLISTLNASFCNDADFSDCKGEDFSKEMSIRDVMDSVDEVFLASPVREEYNSLRTQLWSTINKQINFDECEIYSFRPKESFNPFNEYIIWHFYYFFYSRKNKEIVFFCCRQIRNSSDATCEYLDSFDME